MNEMNDEPLETDETPPLAVSSADFEDEDARMSPATLGWFLGAVLLAAISAWVYAPTLRDGWTRYDNSLLIANEPMVRDLTWDGIRNMFVEKNKDEQGRDEWGIRYHHDMFQPLLTLSLAIDYKLFGREPSAHAGASFPPTDLTGWHIHSLALHLVTVVLFFLLIGRLTGNVLASWVGAALVAFHPLLVEPVSWLICRTFLVAGFWIVLGLHFYLSYARRQRRWLYLLSLICLGLSMLAKLHVGLVVIPLLIDLWCGRKRWVPLLVEKLPIVAMVGTLVWVNSARVFGDAISEPLPEMNVAEMLHRGLVGFGWTAANTFYPRDLSVFYGPVEEPWNLFVSRAWIGGMAVAAILIATSVALFRKRPQLLVCVLGWTALFAPMLAAIRVRETITSDRYNYVPLWMAGLGVAWLLSRWLGSPDQTVRLSEARIASKRPLAFLPIVVLLVLSGWLVTQSRAYARVWSDDVSIWEAAVHRTPHRTAYGQLANALITKAQAPRKRGDIGAVEDLLVRAEQALQAGIEWEEVNADLVGNKGVLFENYGVLCLTWADDLRRKRDSLRQAGDNDDAAEAAKQIPNRFQQAVDLYERATHERSGSAGAWNGLAVTRMRRGDYEHAKPALTRALELAPGYPNARANLTSVLGHLRQKAETEAIRDPGPETGSVLREALLEEARHLDSLGRRTEAEQLRSRADDALSSPADAGDPAADLAWAEQSLREAEALGAQGRRLMSQLRNPNLTAEQQQHLREQTAQASAEMNAQAQTAEAICRRRIAEDETSSAAWSGLAQALMYQGQFEEATEAFSRAVESDPQDANALSSWGRLLAAQGRMDPAANQLRRALEIEPDLESALLDLAKIRVGQERYAEAIPLMEHLHRLQPDSAQNKGILRQLYQQVGRTDDAAALK